MSPMTLESIVNYLRHHGYCLVTSLPEYNSSACSCILRPNTDLFIYFKVKVRGVGRTSITKTNAYFKSEYIGGTFICLRADRSSLVRMFMELLRDDIEWNIGMVRSVGRILNRYLTYAEKVGVLFAKGYCIRIPDDKYMRIDGLVDKPRHRAFKPRY